MKKIFSCFLFFLFVLAANGQIIYMETGKIMSAFDYKDSKGNLLSNLKGSTQNNHGLGIRMPLFESNFHISCGAMYNKYGASGSDPVLRNYYEWEITNLGANLGFDYEFFKPSYKSNNRNGFSFCLKIAGSTEFLLNGTQNLNDEIFDLKKKEEFDKPFYFLRGGVSANYYVSKIIIVFVEYMGGKSFLFGNYKNSEQLRITTHNISVGLAINLDY